VSAAEDPAVVLDQVLADMRTDVQKLRKTLGEVH
jgi:phage shock protein A